MSLRRRVEFFDFGRSWIVMDAHELLPGERDRRVEGSLIWPVIERLCDDVTAWPHLLRLYEAVTSDRLNPPVDVDVVDRVKPALRSLFESGRLVAVSKTSRAKRQADEGVVIKGAAVEQLPVASAIKKILRVIVEKTFLDLTVVDSDGNPMAGRPYKLQLPNGLSEEGQIGASGRFEKNGIDPGTAFFTLLKVPGDPVEASELPVDEKLSFVEIALVDENGSPVPGQKFEITLPDGTKQSGVLNENGVAAVSKVARGSCKVSFPDLDSAAWSAASPASSSSTV